MKWLIGAVITAGAVAAAIGAILALKPGPDTKDIATFTNIDVAPNISLSEYEARLKAQGLARSVGERRDTPVLVVALTPPPPPPPPPPSPQPPPPPSSPPPPPPPAQCADTIDNDGDTLIDFPADPGCVDALDTDEADSSPPPPPPEPPPPPSHGLGFFSNRDGASILNPNLPVVLPDGQNQGDFGDAADKVVEIIKVSGTAPTTFICADKVCTGALPLISTVSTDDAGNPVPPEEAAQNLTKLLDETRATAAGDPIGALISFDVELSGLRNKDVLVWWSIWREGQGTPLKGRWLKSNSAYRLRASSEEDTTNQEIWVPVPKIGGSFYVVLVMTADGERLTAGRSTPFS